MGALNDIGGPQAAIKGRRQLQAINGEGLFQGFPLAGRSSRVKGRQPVRPFPELGLAPLPGQVLSRLHHRFHPSCQVIRRSSQRIENFPGQSYRLGEVGIKKSPHGAVAPLLADLAHREHRHAEMRPRAPPRKDKSTALRATHSPATGHKEGTSWGKLQGGL